LLTVLFKFMVKIELGAEYEVTIEKLIYGAEGLARLENVALFIPETVPGDKVKVIITEAEKNFFRAKVVEILNPSSMRRVAPCSYFDLCGGCQLQHINYSAQLEAKASFIEDSLKRIGRFSLSNRVEVKHAEEFNYRNRVQLKIERSTKPLQIGFYKASSHQVCDIENCLILANELNQALETLRNAQDEIALSEIPYTKIDLIKGVDNISASQKIASLDTKEVFQQVLGINYYFEPNCFFQVNQHLLETLLNIVIGTRKGKLALDLYAGVGFFALQLAKNYQKVIATEVNKTAVKWATHNIKENKINNLEFYDFSTEKWLAKMSRQNIKPDLIVLDPPRVGIIKKTLLSIVALQPKEIVYVSCDPTTLARDLRVLADCGYQLNNVVGIDLFPQTYHIETVASLKK